MCSVCCICGIVKKESIGHGKSGWTSNHSLKEKSQNEYKNGLWKGKTVERENFLYRPIYCRTRKPLGSSKSTSFMVVRYMLQLKEVYFSGMDRIFVLVVGVPLGFIMMVYRYQLKQFTRNVAWAEQYLGAGGTYNLFILIGLAVSVVSLMYALGTIQDFFHGTFGVFFASGSSS